MRAFTPFIILFLLFSIVGVFPFLFFHVFIEKPFIAEVLSVVVCLSFAILPTIWYVKKNGYDEFIIPKKIVPLLLISLLFALSFDMLWYYLLNADELLNHTFRYPKWIAGSSSIAFLSKTLIMAPVFETILMIGFLQKPLAKKISPYIAILIVAVVFSISHFKFTFSDILYYFLMGLVFCFVYYKTEKLLIPILCHFLVNFTASCFRFFPQEANITAYLLVLMLPILFIISFLYLIRLSATMNRAKYLE